jgi:ABC-type sugar transport system ATPase subunit
MLSVQLDDLTVPVRSLSGGQQQSVAIARSLRSDVRVVILDEPTAALGVAQSRNVLELVRRIADRGTAVIMISHDIETVFAIADRITVLRLGEVVHDGPAADLSENELLHLMAGLTSDHSRISADVRPRDEPVAKGVSA